MEHSGDNGRTFLCGGRQVFKDHAVVEVCGALDELCSFLGWAKCLLKDTKAHKEIEAIQRDLFVIGSEISAPVSPLHKRARCIRQEDVHRLEEALARGNKKGRACRDFCLPGDNPLSSSLDICRAVTRRVERQVVGLSRRRLMKNECVIAYLNRLSTLLYAMARAFERKRVRV